MTVPVAVRAVLAAVGALLVLSTWGSMIGTLIVPRPTSDRLTRWVDRIVNTAFRVFTSRMTDHRQRDRVLAAQAAAGLLAQLAAWLGIFFIGYALVLWPFIDTGLGSAFSIASPDVFGANEAVGTAEKILGDLAAFTGLVAVTLQIAYLPTLYAEFNRRENEVSLLNARAGVPSWGPELLARTHYALGSGASTIHTLPELYAAWENWAAEVAESHTTYLPLVRFRSPRPLSSWVPALLAVLDSAALYLALSPQDAPVVPARLCLRSGFDCFRRIGQAMGFDIPDEADPDDSITLTYEEFLYGVKRMKEVGFPLQRDPADAWPDFVGWRVNYERAAYLVAYAVDPVRAKWSGPRRDGRPELEPFRPAPGRLPQPAGQGPDGTAQDRAARSGADSHTDAHERAQLPRLAAYCVP